MSGYEHISIIAYKKEPDMVARSCSICLRSKNLKKVLNKEKPPVVEGPGAFLGNMHLLKRLKEGCI